MNDEIGESPDYNYIISRAFKISWKYKFLWLFGIFLSFGANFNLRFYNLGGLPSSLNTPGFQNSVSKWALTHIWLLAVSFLILFLIWLLFFIMAVISQPAVIKAADESERGGEPKFRTTFSFALKKFWRVLGLMLLIFLIVFAAILLLLIPIILLIIFIAKNSSIGLIVLTALMVALFFIFFIAFVIAIGLVFNYALRYAVITDESVRESIRRGWRLLRHNLGASTLLWLINVGLGMAFGFGFIILILLLAVPTVFFFVFLFSLGFSIAKVALALITGLLLIALIILITGIAQVYFSCYWTLSWLQLNKSLDSNT